MIMLQMNSREVFKDVSDEVQIASTWFFTNWHWPSPLAKEGCLNSKSNCSRSSQQSTQKFFRVFVIIMYINGQRPHTQTKYHKQNISHNMVQMDKVKIVLT